MLFGINYAMFVGLVGGGMIAFEPPAHPPQEKTDWLMTVGTNSPRKAPVGQDGFLTVESRPRNELAWGFKPVYAVGLSVDGGAFATVGVRKDYHFGNLQLTQFFGPALYQSELGTDFKAKELVQFRTGFDFIYNINPKLGIGAGFYHISNAKLTTESAGVDVTRLSIQYKF